MSDGGKGSKPRPFSVTQDEFNNNWDRIFRKKDEKEPSKTNQAGQPVESGELVVSGLQQDTLSRRG